MTTSTKIRNTRTLLLILLILGIFLVVFAALVGLGLPGFIISVAGWIALIVGLVGFVAMLIQKSNAASRTNAWRPADKDKQ
ncbi:MAG: hypothetical protein ACTHU7_04300, partial [Microbacterium sp.]